jgi:hypothetical protein
VVVDHGGVSGGWARARDPEEVEREISPSRLLYARWTPDDGYVEEADTT